MSSGKGGRGVGHLGAVLGGAPRTDYLGVVATGGYVPLKFFTSHKQCMVRWPQYARDTITSLQIVIPNFYWNSVGTRQEAVTGATATITASIEYPAGTFTQAKFNGVAQGSVASGGILVSDPVSVSIPNGAVFYTRIYYTNSAGILYSSWSQGVPTGAVLRSAASGIVDQTMSGTITATDTLSAFGPAAIIARTKVPSIFAIGDSRNFGQFDTPDSSFDMGEVCRSIGAQFGYINIGAPAERSDQFLSSNSLRLPLAAYCSHVIGEHGGADLNQGTPLATIKTNLQAVAALFPGKHYMQCTSVCQTSDPTNNWTTLVDQVPFSRESDRVALNTWIRAVPSGMVGYYEVANAVESAQDSGKWRVDLGRLTADGIHENQLGALTIKNGGNINPSLIHWP